MKTVLKYLQIYSFRAVVGMLIKFTAAICELLIPLLLERIIDVSVSEGDLAAIWRQSGLMMALAFGAVLCNITANRMAAWVSLEITRTLRGDVYRRIETLSCAQMDRFSQATLVSRLTNDTYNVHQMFDKIQRGGVRAPMLVLGGLTLSFLMEPILALIMLLICILTCLTIWFMTRRGIPYYTRAQESVDTVVRILRENASGVRVIRALGQQMHECDRFELSNAEACHQEQRAATTMAATNPLTEFLLSAGLTLVIIMGAYRVNAGLMPAGRVVAFLSYFSLIQTATIGMAKVFVKISKGVASAQRLEEILLLPSEQSTEQDTSTYTSEVGMQDVSFSYLGIEPNIENASFTLQKGEMLGIMGAIGSGKTTLVSLLLRLYEVNSGVVWIGGENVNSQDRRALNGRFGVVFQNSALLSGSIYENIAFLRDISREDALSAAKTAQAMEFISTLPDGMDHHVDIRGGNLSGGQKQRLNIARALAAKPEILVLDSADSALDYRTAAALYAAIRRDYPEITLIVITERVAPLRNADRILLLEDGRIAAQGSHKTLLQASPRYRRIVELQEGGAVL